MGRDLLGRIGRSRREAAPALRPPRRRLPRIVTLVVLVACAGALPPSALAAPVNLIVREVGNGTPITDFTYLVNADNTGDPKDPDPMQRPGVKPTASYSPPVAAGDDTSASFDLPDGRYLISVKAPEYKLWGRHIRLPAEAGNVVVELVKHPLPLAKLVIHAFEDNQSVNAAPDIPEIAGPEPGLAGFQVVLEDTVGEVTVDYNNEPLCGGECVTDANGNVTIDNLGPGKYEVSLIPPDDSWIQTTTFEGRRTQDAWLEEGSDGLGAIGEALIVGEGEVVPTAYWFGFVREMNFPVPGTGTITGTARTWIGWPPFEVLVYGDPVPDPYVALSDITGFACVPPDPVEPQCSDDRQVFTGRGDADGNFTIPNVPAGTYLLSIWDENLDWIIRFVSVTVGPGETVDLNTIDVNGESGVGVARWFGWVSGHVFTDANDDGVMDAGEPGITGVDLGIRFRDGSVHDGTFTDATGYYEFPHARGPLGKFEIFEVGFGRFARTGMSLHDEHDPSVVTPLPTDLGGGLLLNQRTLESHRSIVDWGKRAYLPGENGGITGVVFHATTRNEFDPKLAGAEDYEPGIPDVTLRLYNLGPDGEPNTPDDVLLNEVQSDAWGQATDCDVRDAFGNVLPPSIPDVSPGCIEVPMLASETKDGAFDGGYAIETMCPPDPSTGGSTFPCEVEESLTPGDYVIEVAPPPFYQVIKEEDQNTDEGDVLVPQVPPFPCVGEMHLVNDPRNPANGQERPLCNKKLVTLEDGQNPAADFFLFTTDAPYVANDPESSWNTVEAVAPPGRIIGLVANDLTFETDSTSIWYGEERPVPNIPIGVRDFTGRLITTLTTDEHGYYEVLLPSTQTFNCPTPSGVCPGMYVLRINDPGDPDNPNPNFDPDFLTEARAIDVWPGKTTPADTPLDPISALVCPLDFAGTPEFFRADKVVVSRSGTPAQREVTIDGVRFGATRGSGRVTVGILNGLARTPIPLPASAYLSWSDRQIRFRLPLGFPIGPHQLLITNDAGRTTPSGITFHITGLAYTPPVVNVSAGESIQAAIDAAAPGAIILVGRGTFRENVIMHKKVKVQGFGPGGIVGAPPPGLFPDPGPEDPRFHIEGSVIDARFFEDHRTAWEEKLESLEFAGNQNVPPGAGITVVAAAGAFTPGREAASIDGLGIVLGRGGGAGGIHVNAFARFLRIRNNMLFGNGGEFGGAIALGLPLVGNNENDGIEIQHDRVLGNGGRNLAGGLAIYRGANGYVIAFNDICANWTNEYGGGISHFGESPNGTISRNRIYGNDAFDHGGGIQISGDPPVPPAVLGRPSGPVRIEANLISSNFSNDDGGGLSLLDPLTSRITVVNNMITNNGASDIGGGVALEDASNVVFVNNTLVQNVTSATAEDSDGLPHGAGLISEPHTPAFQASLPPGSPDFSDPVAFFNNVFWQNVAFVFDPSNPGEQDDLEEVGPIDLEVVRTVEPRFFSPRFSILSVPYGTPDPTNLVGADPLVVVLYETQLFAGPTRFNPVEIQTTLFRADPPVLGHDGIPGDYHVQGASPAINAGAASDEGIAAPTTDFDGGTRPVAGAWDIGADEFGSPPSAAARRNR